MADYEQETETRRAWTWIAVVAGAALGAVAVVYLFRQQDPGRRMDRLLRRCEDRIHNIESSLAELESTLSPS